jgi:hypothetical protein
LKRFYLLFLFGLLCLSACAGAPQEVIFERTAFRLFTEQDDTRVYQASDGRELRVERVEQGTRVSTVGQDFLVTGSAEETNVTFPDGRELTRKYFDDGAMGLAPFDADVSIDDWERVDELNEIVFRRMERQASGAFQLRAVLGGLLFLFGLAQALNPHLVWKISVGWRYQNVEPSDMYMLFWRIGGAVMMITALIVFLQ